MSLASRSAIKPPTPQETLTEEARVRWDLIVAAIALGVVIIDQITKALVLNYFNSQPPGAAVHIIGNILTLQDFGNKGAAFSSFTQSPGLLAFLILVAVGVIGWMYWSTRPRNNPWLKATFGFIIGGALGNLIDRVRLGYVVDFVHFQIPSIHFDFAIFNMADSAISIGIVALAVIFWTLPRESAEEAAEEKLAGAKVGAVTAKSVSPASSSTAKATAPVQPRAVSATPKTPTNPVKSSAATKSATSAAAKTPTNPVKTPAATATAKPASNTPKAVTAGSAPKSATPKAAGAGKSKRKHR